MNLLKKYTVLYALVTSFPIESGFEVLANVNSMEEMQNMLDARFSDAYAVYNLSNRPYRSDHWFHGRVSHRGFEAHRAPALKSLIELCLNARLWLAQKSNNICVIHCTDGKTLSAVLACSLLCFCRVFDNASPAIQLFASKRGNPGLNASQIRYKLFVLIFVPVLIVFSVYITGEVVINCLILAFKRFNEL